jgi:hypothetical protein
MKELTVIYLLPTVFLVALAAWFLPIGLCAANPVTGGATRVIVLAAAAGLAALNVVFFRDPTVRGQLAIIREMSRLRRQERAERLAAIAHARAAVIVHAAALRAEQAATSALEEQFSMFAAAQAELCGTFNSAAIELQNLKHLPPAEVAEYSHKLETNFQRVVDHLSLSSLSPLLLESPK